MTTVEYQVGASSDDADQTFLGAAVILTSAPLISLDKLDEWHGHRWTGVTIPSGATIDTAYIDLNIINTVQDEPDVTIDFEDSSTPGTFTTGVNDISGRTGTTATVAWDDANYGIASNNTWLTSIKTPPEIKTIIQELVDSYDYSSGLAMVARFEGQDDVGDRDLRPNSYDGSTSWGAKLHIEYTAAGGGRTTKNTDPYGLGLAIGVSRTFKVHG